MNREQSTDRPTASGHRFGPDLTCSECGIGWDEHQRNPLPCKTEATTNVFNRRPSGATSGAKESSQAQRRDSATDGNATPEASDSTSGTADSSRED